MSPCLLWEKDPSRTLNWRKQETKYKRSQGRERHNYGQVGIMVWDKISVGDNNDQNMLCGGALTGVIYRDETLDQVTRVPVPIFHL
ncbi:hypothetical protein AVEN_190835-1 [Araneus ventricosus]|uniref:Uncharacterized protein n=1 Tax=Araneus ventricosus TaxID=182803 RepID=A0A4Y2E2T0_ARAVE|nr:hypothetical protein AVEN_190835-1 [Araneus ventricosus]